MRFHTEPKGHAYEQIIDYAIRHSPRFVLSDKRVAPRNPDWCSNTDAWKALEPFLEETLVIKGGEDLEEVMRYSQLYRSNAFYSGGTYYFYRCCAESGELLKRMAACLSDWNFPHLPEDLCFLKEGGGDFLYSIAHESMYGLNVSEEEAVALMNEITGLFLELQSHKKLECLLEDAIKHQTDKLYISGHKLKELPDRIRELTELRELEIFERDLFRLPEELFELSKLESLQILTSDLEGIPASIAKLKNLKSLSIGCGSSDRTDGEWRLKPKQEISLNRLPPEIGQLEKLERLSLHYTAIRELPPELKQLERLEALDVSSCMIEQKPDFLDEMKQLKYIIL